MATRAQAEAALAAKPGLAALAARFGVTITGTSPVAAWNDAIAWGLSAVGHTPDDATAPDDEDVQRVLNSEWGAFLDWAGWAFLRDIQFSATTAGNSVSFPEYTESTNISSLIDLIDKRYQFLVKLYGPPKQGIPSITPGTISVQGGRSRFATTNDF